MIETETIARIYALALQRDALRDQATILDQQIIAGVQALDIQKKPSGNGQALHRRIADITKCPEVDAELLELDPKGVKLSGGQDTTNRKP